MTNTAATTTTITIGTKVRTRFGWVGTVEGLDCALALVIDWIDDDDPLNGANHTAWERLSDLQVV